MELPQYNIIYTSLPAGAQLDPWEGVVYMDFSFQSSPEIVRNFAYFHELGHLFYDTPDSGRSLKTEMLCDNVAADQLVRAGKSRTQILGALDTCLVGSSELPARSLNLKNYLSWMAY